MGGEGDVTVAVEVTGISCQSTSSVTSAYFRGTTPPNTSPLSKQQCQISHSLSPSSYVTCVIT